TSGCVDTSSHRIPGPASTRHPLPKGRADTDSRPLMCHAGEVWHLVHHRATLGASTGHVLVHVAAPRQFSAGQSMRFLKGDFSFSGPASCEYLWDNLLRGPSGAAQVGGTWERPDVVLRSGVHFTLSARSRVSRRAGRDAIDPRF